MFKTTAHKIPITTFSTLSVQERRKLSAYVSYIWTPISLQQTFFQIGINYFGQEAELKGCINDANNMQDFLCSEQDLRLASV